MLFAQNNTVGGRIFEFSHQCLYEYLPALVSKALCSQLAALHLLIPLPLPTTLP